MNELGLHDIYTFIHVPFWQTWSFFWLMMALSTLIGGLVAFNIYKRFFPAAPITPWQNALNQLASIEKKGLLNSKHAKYYYTSLTHVIKKYLSERYSVALMGKSDVEVMKQLYALNLSAEQTSDLESIFTNGVLIKFAPAHAAQEMIQSDFERAKKCISATIPTELHKK